MGSETMLFEFGVGGLVYDVSICSDNSRMASLCIHNVSGECERQFCGCRRPPWEFDGSLDGGPIWRSKKRWPIRPIIHQWLALERGP